jgi:hypothetical protein
MKKNARIISTVRATKIKISENAIGRCILGNTVSTLHFYPSPFPSVLVSSGRERFPIQEHLPFRDHFTDMVLIQPGQGKGPRGNGEQQFVVSASEKSKIASFFQRKLWNEGKLIRIDRITNLIYRCEIMERQS